MLIFPARSGTFLAKTINISVNFQALNKVFHFLLVAEDRNIKKLAPIAMSFYSVMEVYYILSPSDIVHNVILFHNRLFYLVITKIVHLKSFGQLVRPGSIVRLTRSVKSFGRSLVVVGRSIGVEGLRVSRVSACKPQRITATPGTPGTPGTPEATRASRTASGS